MKEEPCRETSFPRGGAALGQVTGVEGTQQRGGLAHQLSREGWPSLGRWVQDGCLKGGDGKGKQPPPGAGGFGGAAGKQEVGKGVVEAGVPVGVGRDPRRVCGCVTGEQGAPRSALPGLGVPQPGLACPPGLEQTWSLGAAPCAAELPSEGSGWQAVASPARGRPACSGQPPGARYRQLAANGFPAWLLACWRAWSRGFSMAQHLGHLMPCLRGMEK